MHAVVARSTCPSQNVQNTPGSDHFGSSDVEKVRAVVARSIFPSQNVTNTFWKLRCRKVHGVVARSTFPSQKCQKTWGSDPLFDFQMLEKCTALWREAHFKSNVSKTEGFEHVWTFRCGKSGH